MDDLREAPESSNIEDRRVGQFEQMLNYLGLGLRSPYDDIQRTLGQLHIIERPTDPFEGRPTREELANPMSQAAGIGDVGNPFAMWVQQGIPYQGSDAPMPRLPNDLREGPLKRIPEHK